MAKVKTPAAVLELGVNYGSISVGDEICSLGLSVERRSLSLGKADQHLVNKRLTVTITAAPGSDNPEQEVLPGMEGADISVTAQFDVKGFSVGRKFIRFHLSAPKTAVDLAALMDFPKRAGKFSVLSIDAIPEKPARPAKEEEDEDPEE